MSLIPYNNYFTQLINFLGSLSPLSEAGKTLLVHTNLSVSTSSQVVLAENAKRRYVLLINDSDTAIYLKIGADAVVGEGIRINPNGGSFEMSAILGNLDTRAIYAIHGSTGSKNLLIVEGS